VNRRIFRVIDTGVYPGRYNIALDQALTESKRAGLSPDTLRFLEFSPSALVGRHQDISRELDLEYCHANAIDIGRRITGGGAIYLDQRQLGWELICARANLPGRDLAEVAERICTGAAAGLQQLGVNARFRPRNDIEVEGRKISGTGGFFDGGTLFYQGTVLLGLNAETMFRALRVPDSKRQRQGVEDAAERVTSLDVICDGPPPALPAIKAALTSGIAGHLGFEVRSGELSAAERAGAAATFDDEVGTDAFVYEIDRVNADDGWSSASRATNGGTVTAAVKFAVQGRPRVSQLLISGDYFVTPPRVIYDLECALKDVAVADVDERVAAFFAAAEVDLMSFSIADLRSVIDAAMVMAAGDAAWTTSPA
jgi:lipoate-protein ligase A